MATGPESAAGFQATGRGSGLWPRAVGVQTAGEATGATGLFTFGGVAFVPTVFTAIVTLADSYAAGYLFAALLPALVGGALLRRARNAGIPAP